MAKQSKNAKNGRIRDLVRDIEDLVDGEKWLLDKTAAMRWKKEPWAGAGTVVCEQLPTQVRSAETYVVSPYVVELSWLIDSLQIACRDFVDFRNKDAFYGRLADAANRYLTQRPVCHINAKDLCFAVLREAMRIVDEAGRGALSPVRNEVQVKQTWVQLHPAGSDEGAGLAVYSCPVSPPSTLANEAFIFRGKAYRIGKTHEQFASSDGERVTHIAVYHGADDHRSEHAQ
jgi:hypothetical protein